MIKSVLSEFRSDYLINDSITRTYHLMRTFYHTKFKYGGILCSFIVLVYYESMLE